MAELGKRFEKTPEKVAEAITQAATELRTIFAEGAIVSFTLWYLPEAPLYAMYRFDNLLILTMYKHRRERGGVPVFQIKNGGTLFDFADKDFESFVSPDSPAKKVFSTQNV